jgi:hypothetical protein
LCKKKDLNKYKYNVQKKYGEMSGTTDEIRHHKLKIAEGVEQNNTVVYHCAFQAQVHPEVSSKAAGTASSCLRQHRPQLPRQHRQNLAAHLQRLQLRANDERRSEYIPSESQQREVPETEPVCAVKW